MIQVEHNICFMLGLEELITKEFWAGSVEHIRQNTGAPECEVVDASFSLILT